MRNNGSKMPKKQEFRLGMSQSLALLSSTMDMDILRIMVMSVL